MQNSIFVRFDRVLYIYTKLFLDVCQTESNNISLSLRLTNTTIFHFLYLEAEDVSSM